MAEVPALRLLADDLTGALDTAAEFAGLVGPVRVGWDATGPLPRSAALDSGTREADAATAVAAVRALAPRLRGAGLAYKKVDSLLRGHVAAELVACLALGAWPYAVVAPAFPGQRRVTRGGRQYAGTPDGGWRAVGDDLVAELRAAGLPARAGRWDAPLSPGVWVFDAETEADLDRVVALGRAAPGPVLWCGTGGLARALARGAPAPASAALRGPVLGLFGSDQAVTARQLGACGPHWLRLPDGGAGSAARVAGHLARHGAALVSLDLPAGTARVAAAARIGAGLAALTRGLSPPGTLIAAGGETLRGLCDALGADGLDAIGQVAPGVPRSVLRGGRWDGVEVISKSGAFGGDALWRDLLAANGLLVKETA